MRRARSFVMVLALVSMMLAIACTSPEVIAAGKAVKIDFWFTQKGSVSVPAGWKSTYEEFCNELPIGDQYSYSGHTTLSLNRKTGMVSIVAADFRTESEAKKAVVDLPTSWRRSCPYGDIMKLPPNKASSVKLGRVGGGLYLATKYTFRTQETDQILIVCRGQKTKYGSEIKWQGQDVIPVYVVQILCPWKDKGFVSGMDAILNSLKLP